MLHLLFVEVGSIKSKSVITWSRLASHSCVASGANLGKPRYSLSHPQRAFCYVCVKMRADRIASCPALKA